MLILTVVKPRCQLSAYTPALSIIHASSRQKHTSALPKDYSLPSTIRKNTSVVEHVLYVFDLKW
jgi:hypothetical protein